MKKSSRKDRFWVGLATFALLFTIISLPQLVISWFSAPNTKEAVAIPAASSGLSIFSFKHDLKNPLSAADANYYKQAFAAQKANDWHAADDALAKVQNRLIEGYVLKERYLQRNYDTSAFEIEAWLAQYFELPQAYEVYNLGRAKFPQTISKLQPITKPTMVTVMGDDNGLASSFAGSKHFTTWNNAIAAYAKKDYAKTADLLEDMLKDSDTLSPWKRSAAGYWAWRAYDAMGQKDKARTSLEIAANEPQSFYGILAANQLKKNVPLVENDLSFSAAEIESLEKKPTVLHALALSQAGRQDLAEQELRAGYITMSAIERPMVLKLASRMSLPALQIALAKRFETADNTVDSAKFPIPDWEPVGGFSVDPALIYALVRQESGFRAGALSPAGATGLMQLMPTTAQMMNKHLGDSMAGIDEASRNVTLGQNYVRHLLNNPLVDNNVIFMLTAYNAGIGRLQTWKSSIDYQNDPLLFIEQMPYAETRHYVMQVMTNYWLYSKLLGVKNPTLASLANLEWPVYNKG